MLDFTGPIFVYTRAADMRKSIDGLSMLASDFMVMRKDGEESSTLPVEDTPLIFVFINRGHDKIKILLKEGNGFCLVYKRLDRGCFKINLRVKGPLQLSRQELRWLLDGLDYAALKPLKSASYGVVF